MLLVSQSIAMALDVVPGSFSKGGDGGKPGAVC